MPHDLALKGMNLAHRAITTLSFGRLGWRAMGMPVIELTTTGRTSGQPRAVFLTSPLETGDGLVIVASRGGDDHHPAWFLNLRDDPEVQVSVEGGERRGMVARVTDGDEREQLWAELTEAYPHYGGYQRRTEREIPVVVLEAPDPAPS
jgi:deazaflavin-dependent oxidoreductase (nitroreductase family)